jgi:hypothetical protein
MTTNMKGTPGAVYKPRSGTTYIPDANGNISAAAGQDIIDLLDDGCTFAGSSQLQGASGLYPMGLRLSEFKNADGSALAASAAAGKFGYAITLGTNFYLVSEAANSNTKTDDAIFEYVLPASYVKGQNLTVTVNASITGSGTLSTKTAQIKAYRCGTGGTQGADIGPGAATEMTAAGADVTFTITGTTLNPGDKVVFLLETVLTETAASAMTAHINSIRLS